MNRHTQYNKANKALQRMNPHPEIELVEDGFALRGAKKEVVVSFDDVRAIRAQKIDLFSFDEIRVTFDRKKEEPVEISEESRGYDELMARVLSRFPGSDPNSDFSHVDSTKWRRGCLKGCETKASEHRNRRHFNHRL